MVSIMSIFFLGDELSLRFTEELTCTRPFLFNVSLNRDDGGAALTVGRDLDVICRAELIEVAFR